MAKAQSNTPQVVVYNLACPYCGKYTFTICSSILTHIPESIKHLVFSNVQCHSCGATFAEAVMTDEKRNREQRELYLVAQTSLPSARAAVTAG